MGDATILVVDDESRMRKLIKDFLIQKNYNILEAEDGEKAFDAFVNKSLKDEDDNILNGINLIYTFDYKDQITQVENGTQSQDDGLANTSSSYSSVLAASSEFEKFLQSVSQTPTTSFTKNEYDQSAIRSALKKNAVPRGGEGEQVFADVDKAEINWYLPAVKEAASGVYQENSEAHSCETSFLDDNGVGKVYWTSTSANSTHAYTYKYGSTITDAFQQKDATYHVRAIRRSTTTN